MNTTYSNYGVVSDYHEEQKRVSQIALDLRRLRNSEFLTTWKQPAEWAVKMSNMYGNPTKALTITLSPTGCSWADAGGCTMCGEFEGSKKSGKIAPEFHIAQFSKAAAELITKYKPTWLRINQEGNYANGRELDELAQNAILGLAVQIKGLRRITIESRPEFLTEEAIRSYRKIIEKSDVELEIGMGFESKDDVIRNVCINKREEINGFVKALDLMNEHGILPLAYIVLKPPFLTEGEAINEAIETIRYADTLGFKRISLEPMSIHKYTVVDALSRVGEYRVPWLWSVIKVARQCRDIPELGIGGIGFYPRPYHLSRNHCDNLHDCNKSIWDALKDFSERRDFFVFDSLSCDCIKVWEEDCAAIAPPLKQRISKQLSRIDIEQYGKQVSKDPVEPAPQSTILIAGGAQVDYVSKGTQSL